ncbi:keratin, type I cytoskeletal 19-like [Spea bombifrons]|uniref:keratin, type I cytoskeletal 19-like n=1 Tax=Spea bombifrons TaxID=233779 RepID=UPI00234B562A|nr:keratin, type I cytoskeletal 19-like [Spea bombifrons]
MSRSIHQSHSSAGSFKGICKIGHSFSNFSHIGSEVHRGGSHVSHHGGSPKLHHGGFNISHHGSSHNVHHGGHYRAPSVHGGSGGKGISISRNSSFTAHTSHKKGMHGSSSSGHSGWKKDGLFNVNEKETMQCLNDRLASYLEKVRLLEQENKQLERNIRDWYERNQPSTLPDFGNYFRTIQELQGQVSSAAVENARIVLQIDNARLAADDLRNKYEMELQLSNNVQSDIKNLRGVLEGLNREVCDLDAQVRNLQEQLQQMKRNHEEEVNSLRAQLGQRVNVEVDAAPSVDLNRALSEIRQQYENLMERNLREVESMFLQRTEELNRQVASGAEQLQSVQTEVIDLRRTVQTLEIELQSQLSMKSALEGTLAETEATYNSQLSQLQGLINAVESQLAQIRSDLEQQNHQYRILMDQKTHLEMEIATYKRLLEGHDFHSSGHHYSGAHVKSQHSVSIHSVKGHVAHKC